jgi:hypothetical protein
MYMDLDMHGHEQCHWHHQMYIQKEIVFVVAMFNFAKFGTSQVRGTQLRKTSYVIIKDCCYFLLAAKHIFACLWHSQALLYVTFLLFCKDRVNRNDIFAKSDSCSAYTVILAKGLPGQDCHIAICSIKIVANSPKWLYVFRKWQILFCIFRKELQILRCMEQIRHCSFRARVAYSLQYLYDESYKFSLASTYMEML